MPYNDTHYERTLMRLFKGIFAVILGFYATVILALLLIFLTTNLILLTN